MQLTNLPNNGTERVIFSFVRLFCTATQESLKEFNPLFCLNYSATHKQHHTLVYVLDALDAYNKRLVKKIEVKGFDINNLRGTDRYLFLEKIII